MTIFAWFAGVLVVPQNGIDIGLAKMMGASLLLGLMCGSVNMTGGHGTALGFAPELAKAGLEGSGGRRCGRSDVRPCHDLERGRQHESLGRAIWPPFLMLPIVGAFLIDFVNATNITIFLNLIQP